MLEILKDHDMAILYHIGKDNVQMPWVERQQIWAVFMLVAELSPLAMHMNLLDNSFMWLDISKPYRVYACFEVHSLLVE